jgi:hypothetical protein
LAVRRQRTRPDFLLAASAPLLEFIDSIDGDQDLNCRDGIEHVGIVAWSSTEASIATLTGENEVDGLFSWQGIWVAQDMQGC